MTMPTVKTAISIERSLFDRVNDLAEELQVPRSQLFAAAVEEYIRRYENQQLLERLNQAYSDVPSPDEKALHEGMRQQHRRLLEGQW
jgi:metal-responsive CopG/Arc/MetJ family transcriptional regulator